MGKLSYALSGALSLFGGLVFFALWSAFGGSFSSLKAVIYFLLLVVPFLIHAVVSFVAVHNASLAKTVVVVRVMIGVGLITAALLGKLY